MGCIDSPEEDLDIAPIDCEECTIGGRSASSASCLERHQRYFITIVGVVLTSILVHLGVVTDKECDSLVLLSAVPVDPLVAIYACHVSLEDELARIQVQLEEACVLRVETEAEVARLMWRRDALDLGDCFKTSHYPPHGVEDKNPHSQP
ncbi:hypothetical protein R1flu_013936 [Riccia fluitans]|uniref:Uncharacterized protein n=1 Tax=Riccia fluitans TaxID=41844 RepID=A0ABD1YF05_9MARC